MIDIHSHILPGLDDGAKTLDDALEMARLAVAGGTTVMFATPHVIERQDLDRVERTAEHVANLQAALEKEQIPLELLPGAEIYPMEGLIEALDAGLPLTLGLCGKTLLLDSPLSALPLGLDDLVYRLQANGFQVILAHPERVAPIQQHPQVLEELVYRGLLLQINASSLLGSGGEMAVETAESLLRHNWVHFVASDCHSPERRRPGMAQAARVLAELVDAEVVEALLVANGRRIIDGESVPSTPLAYTPRKKRKSAFAWFGRGK